MNTVTFDQGTFVVAVLGIVLIVCGLMWAAFTMGVEYADHQHYLQFEKGQEEDEDRTPSV